MVRLGGVASPVPGIAEEWDPLEAEEEGLV